MHPQSVLLLEDDPLDALLIQRALEQGGVVARFSVAQSRQDYLHSLNAAPVDLVISDSSIVNLPPLEAIALATGLQRDAAFIVLSGAADPALARSAIAHGAMAWLDKSDLGQLVPMVRQALASKLQPKTTTAPRAVALSETAAAQRLVQTVKELSAARELPAIQAIVRTAARELAAADGATFVLREGDQCFYADESAIAPLFKGQRFAMHTCIGGWAMRHAQAAVIADVGNDPRIPAAVYRATFVRSLVMVPIRPEAPVGAIGVYWAEPHAPSAAEVGVIQALADATSIAMENVALYRELEDRVVSRTAELRRVNQSLQEFTYFVSHDLRAPLRHIEAFAQLLQAELPAHTSPAALEALGHIHAEAQTMAQLVTGLLSLATSGNQPLRVSPVAMDQLVAAAIAAQAKSAVAVEYRLAPLGSVPGDAVLLQRVWTNLIANAIKYSSRSAHPVIEIGPIAAGPNELGFSVRDNGIGFDMKQAEALFRPFQRLHPDSGFAGVGVGLAIVQRIITRHGGRVWAESAPGQGAQFCFALPAQTDPHY